MYVRALSADNVVFVLHIKSVVIVIDQSINEVIMCIFRYVIAL